MTLTPLKINLFLLSKLPAAWFCGVRVKELRADYCRTGVTHRWINQNPFGSMYFAVQAMAAELSTGALVMAGIRERKRKISMLVAQNEASFSKKAKGKIRFTCEDGLKIKAAIKETLATGEGQTCWMHAIGKNSKGEIVATFKFEWTVKVKT